MQEESEIRINNWNELQEQLYVESWQPDLERFRSPYVFRGLNEASHGLETTLARLGGSYGHQEKHLLRNFRKYARANAVEQDTIWHWLSLAKHHGLPTRLLDWSFSPFVSMHFATSNPLKFEQDGIIWAAKFGEAHKLSPERLQTKLAEEGSGVFTIEMLNELIPSLEELDSLAEQPFTLFFEPPSLDERIVNQFALFSMMSSAESELQPWLENRSTLYKKVIIPAELKWEIRDKLDQANITERVLFPGLDGLSRWLKRHYAQRSK
jgi:hypothetical protein